jgi:hypothetical protein
MSVLGREASAPCFCATTVSSLAWSQFSIVSVRAMSEAPPAICSPKRVLESTMHSRQQKVRTAGIARVRVDVPLLAAALDGRVVAELALVSCVADYWHM